jgi:hypothetical protein
MRARNDQEPLVLDGLVDDLTKARGHGAAPGFADLETGWWRGFKRSSRDKTSAET